MRCEAWKDEVQNLLIFAGLFSAVVTGFIIESYKNLQPDPEDVMINLLSQIATRLERVPGLNTTSTEPPLAQAQFSPSSSTIRVNTFWLISLVLSLATVLVGIVSLQWLREHQSYPDLTPRQRYAIYHMRDNGIKKWQVHRIFTALPLLLQCALVLFLSGLVDFFHSLGEWRVTIPVTIVIFFTLAFLICTAILPSLQGLSLYLPAFGQNRSKCWNDPPSQCPYKSPQSHAIRTLLRPVFRLLFRLYPYTRIYAHKVKHLATSLVSKTNIAPSLTHDHFSRYIYYAYKCASWIDFDLEWLSIRDAYMRRAFGRSSWYEELGQRDDDTLPIHDIVGGLQNQCSQKSSYGPAYFCMTEISELALLPLDTGDFCYHTAEDRCRQSAYLHDLLCRVDDTCISDYFILDSFFQGSGPLVVGNTQTLASILHQQNLFSFLRHGHLSDGTSQAMHRKELALRLMRFFFRESLQLGFSGKAKPFSRCLAFDQFLFCLDRDLNREKFNAIGLQIMDATLSLFRQLGKSSRSDSIVRSAEVQQGALSIHIETASSLTANVFMPDGNAVSSPMDARIKNAFYFLFTFIEKQLKREISSWTPNSTHPSLLFYASALYTHRLVAWEDPIFCSLYTTLCQYKAQTIDVGIIDSTVEGNLTYSYDNAPWLYSSYTVPFSTQWWGDFNP